MSDLVECNEVVRSPLEVEYVFEVLHRAELKSPVGQRPDVILTVVATSLTDDLSRSFDDPFKLWILAPKDDRVGMFDEGQPDNEVGLPAAGRAAVEEFISLTCDCFRLRSW
jgi:hypothetical protein